MPDYYGSASSQESIKVCYFGSYDPKYTRNRVIIFGLKQNGVNVFECQDASSILLRYFKLLWKYLYLKKHDVIIVHGHGNVPLAWLLAKIFRRKLIFDPFISLYDTAIFDRKEVDEKSVKAKYYYYLDKWCCALADIVMVDTWGHLRYFHEEFGIKKEKFRRVLVGADDTRFYPVKTEKEDDKFRVLFYGTYIPLHGIEYIVKAAKLLENNKDIVFEIFGSGQTYKNIKSLSEKLKIKNILFKIDWVEEDPQRYIGRVDVCLGIFGGTPKAKRVVPNKAYQAIAMEKPLITGDSPAAREVFSNKENAILCVMANPKAIAESILLLKEDEKLRRKIAKNGYTLFKERFTPQAIGKEVKIIIEEVMKN
jgi:glycosyltransferase involved in cell wall biosynthesis